MPRSLASMLGSLLLVLGCGEQSVTATGSTGTSDASGSTSAEPVGAPPTPIPVDVLGPGKQPEPPSQAALEAAIPTEPPPLNFWELGAAACAPGGRLEGGLPPTDRAIRCVDEQGRWTGPDAVFHGGEGQRLHLIGRREQSKMVGVWQWFHPNGTKALEQPYVDGQLHGTTHRFDEDGTELEVGEYRAGRPWGLFISRDEQGNELARAQLDAGTGRLQQATSSGRTESDYVHGLLHGTHREFDAGGRLVGESRWSGGEMHGLETRYDGEGRKWIERSHVLGQLDGPATRWKDGVIVERSIWVAGLERSRQLYRDGQPLAELPTPTPCDTDVGIALTFERSSDDGCIARAPLFPGVALIGDFAHDRGCMDARWVVDCKLVATRPSAAELLARAGWAKANPEQRSLLAQEYLVQLALVWDGSITSDPEEPIWTVRDDGGIEAVVWVVEPAGMQIGRELDKLRFEFGPDGELTRTALEHRSTPE